MSHLTVCSASVYEHEWRQRWSDCSHFLFLLVFIDLGSRSTSCCGSNQLIFKNPTLMSVNCQKTLGNTCRFFNVYFGNFKQKSILLLQESLHFTRACAGDAFQLAPVYIYSSQPLHSFEGPVIINCISTALKWVIACILCSSMCGPLTYFRAVDNQFIITGLYKSQDTITGSGSSWSRL